MVKAPLSHCPLRGCACRISVSHMRGIVHPSAKRPPSATDCSALSRETLGVALAKRSLASVEVSEECFCHYGGIMVSAVEEAGSSKNAGEGQSVVDQDRFSWR